MDAADEQRLLHILGAAQGDPAALALVPLDLTFADVPESERDRLRTALIAAAVPHWFDVPFLAALLATSRDEAYKLMGKLQRVTNVETFPARGNGVCDVHEASRLALREHLRLKHPDLWQAYAQRAHAHLAAGLETHERIEALYHHFAADAEAAVVACEKLDRDLRQNPTTRAALCLTLNELRTEGWLTGAALVEALRAPLWYRSSRGEVSQLETEARALLDLARAHAHSSRVSNAYDLLGDVHYAHGELAKAIDCNTESKTIREHLCASDPSNIWWQRDLSVSLDNLGKLAEAQGDLATALRYFTQSKTIAERLAASDPANAAWQRQLSISLYNLGRLAEAQGDLAGALHYFKEDKAIAERLVASDPSNAAWQRDLAISLERLGQLAVEQGDLAGALLHYAESKIIFERLAGNDPSNAAWQHDLAWSYIKLGDVESSRERVRVANDAYQQSKMILDRLHLSDPLNSIWAWSLSITHDRVGTIAEKSGDREAAIMAFTKLHNIMEHLAASDPSNAGCQRDFSISLNRLGKLAEAQGDLAGALRYFTESKTIAERLAASDPANAAWQRDLWVSYWKLADLCEKSQQPADAQEWWQRSYGTLSTMKERGLHVSPQDLGFLERLRAKVGEA